MRIAYVCCDSGVPVFGSKGCSVHVQEVLREFLRRGAKVDLFASRTGGGVPSDLLDVRLHLLPVPREGSVDEREQKTIASNAQLARALSEHGPYDLVYERFSLFAHAAMQWAHEQSTPGILEINSPLVEEQARYRSLIHVASAERSAHRAMAAAGAVVAVSKKIAEYVRRNAVPSRRIHVVANGVNAERFALSRVAREQRVQPAFTIGFLGTLKPWHGVNRLIDALGLMIDRGDGANLLVVGDGPQRTRLTELAASLPAGGAAQVEFTGAVPPAQVPELLARVDVAAAPYPQSDDFYFSPLKILEYMAAGLPTVASRVGQVTQLLEHERTGLLVPPGDDRALSDALLRLRRDDSLRQRLGAAARVAAESKHSWSAVVAKILAIAAALQTLGRVDSRSSTSPYAEFPSPNLDAKPRTQPLH